MPKQRACTMRVRHSYLTNESDFHFGLANSSTKEDIGRKGNLSPEAKLVVDTWLSTLDLTNAKCSTSQRGVTPIEEVSHQFKSCKMMWVHFTQSNKIERWHCLLLHMMTRKQSPGNLNQ
jgi:hypothetical protein